jgi:uncharacterized protein YkwD
MAAGNFPPADDHVPPEQDPREVAPIRHRRQSGNVLEKDCAGQSELYPYPAMMESATQVVKALALMGALVACSPGITTTLPASSPTPAEANVATSIYQQVNAYRQSHGLLALQRNTALDYLAQQHATFMCKNRGKFVIYGATVTHYGFESRSFAAQQYYHMDQVGENVAATSRGGNQLGNQLVGLWLHSPSHERNMRYTWTCTGVGVVVGGDGTVFAVQMFGTLKNQSHLEMLNRLKRH